MKICMIRGSIFLQNVKTVLQHQKLERLFTKFDEELAKLGRRVLGWGRRSE